MIPTPIRQARIIAIVLVVSCVALHEVDAQNWPQFRGPSGTGIASDQNLPDTWNPDSGQNVLWQIAVPGLAHSSPIVFGDHVYLTTAIAAPESDVAVDFGTGSSDVVGSGSTDDLVAHRWELLAVDKRSGEVSWRRTVHEGVPRLKRHVKASHASQTPATDGKHLVVLIGSEGLFCFDMNGELLWRKDLGLLDVGYWGERQYQWGAASSPVIHRDRVLVQNDRHDDSFLAAYDLESGEEIWRAPRDEKPAWSTPALVAADGRVQIVTNGANWIRANDPTTGEELWRISHEDLQVITPSPIVAGESVVVTGGNPTGAQPIYVIAPGARDADERVLWKAERGSPYTPTPLALDGILYVIVDNGILSTYDIATGERIYRTRLAVGSGFSASPVAADGKVYFASEDGELYVVRAGREFECLLEVDMGEALMATPALSDGILVVRGRNHLFGIGRES